MASIYLHDFIDICLDGTHDATSWQVALDSDFSMIVDESIQDKVNLIKWNTPLPMINGVGYYADLSTLYARIKVHIENTVSDWFVLPAQNQNYQKVIITQVGKDNIITDSSAINMK